MSTSNNPRRDARVSRQYRGQVEMHFHSLDSGALDGMRVRASVGKSSFRSKASFSAGAERVATAIYSLVD